MLSLPPRFDQFRFMIPKEFIPEVIRNKYDEIIAKNANVFTNSMDSNTGKMKKAREKGIKIELY